MLSSPLSSCAPGRFCPPALPEFRTATFVLLTRDAVTLAVEPVVTGASAIIPGRGFSALRQTVIAAPLRYRFPGGRPFRILARCRVRCWHPVSSARHVRPTLTHDCKSTSCTSMDSHGDARWLARLSLFSMVWGIPGMLDDGSRWLSWFGSSVALFQQAAPFMFFGGLAGISVWAIERFVARRFYHPEPKPIPISEPAPAAETSAKPIPVSEPTPTPETAAKPSLKQKPTPLTDPQPDKSHTPPDLPERTANSRSTPNPRNWCPRTMKQLVQMVSGRTGLAKQSTLQPFVGQFLRVNGATRNVERYEKDMPIHVGVEADSGVYVQCWMRKGHHEQYLAQLNIGDPFCAVGKLNDVGEASISLNECELQFSERST